MNKSRFRFVKTSVAALICVATCFFLFSSVRQASASEFGVSLNLRGTVLTFGIGDAVAVAPALIVVDPEPATIPPGAVVPSPKPCPRYVHKVVPKHSPMKKSVVPFRKSDAPTIRTQTPERPPKPLNGRLPYDFERTKR